MVNLTYGADEETGYREDRDQLELNVTSGKEVWKDWGVERSKRLLRNVKSDAFVLLGFKDRRNTWMGYSNTFISKNPDAS